jgi:hypothetical protein
MAIVDSVKLVQPAGRIAATGAAVVSAVVWGAVLAPAGAAAGDPPAVNPAIAQYVEMVPTATGTVASGNDGSKAEIPGRTRQQIKAHGGSDADLLTKVVSSEGYGAPKQYSSATSTTATQSTASTTTSTPAKPKPKPAAARPKPATPTAPKPDKPPKIAAAPLPAAPNPFSSATGSFGVEGLLFVLAMIAAVVVAVAPRLRRQLR